MKLKLHLVILINHVLLLYGFYYFLSWPHLALSLVGYFLIIKVSIECGYHRFFCHKAFAMNSKFKIIILLFGALAGFGSALSWSAVHRLHHKYADTEKDPHGKMSKFRVWFGLWRNFEIQTKDIKDLIRDKHVIFFHKNYFEIIFLLYAVCFFYPAAVIYFIIIPSVVGFHAAGLINTVGHDLGYQNYITPDKSRNNFFLNLLFGGNGLHNNHHARPQSKNYSLRWFEFDLNYYFIRIISKRNKIYEI